MLHFHLVDALLDEVFRVELEALGLEGALGDGLEVFVALVEEVELLDVGLELLHYVYVFLTVEGLVLEWMAIEDVIGEGLDAVDISLEVKR